MSLSDSQDDHQVRAQVGREAGEAAYRVIKFAGAKLPEAYHGYVLARWKRSLRHGNDYYRLVKPDAYYDAYNRYLDQLVRHDFTEVRLAVLADDSDVVLGFASCRGSILDYVYVNKDMRGHGIARSLVPKHIETITHLTKTGLVIWSNKCPKWNFNPFA